MASAGQGGLEGAVEWGGSVGSLLVDDGESWPPPLVASVGQVSLQVELPGSSIEEAGLLSESLFARAEGASEAEKNLAFHRGCGVGLFCERLSFDEAQGLVLFLRGISASNLLNRSKNSKVSEFLRPEVFSKS